MYQARVSNIVIPSEAIVTPDVDEAMWQLFVAVGDFWKLGDDPEPGHRVVHLVRSGRAESLGDGVALDVFDRRKGHKRNFCGLYRLDATEKVSPTDTFELVIVPVKHYGMPQTLKEIVPQLGQPGVSMRC